MIIRLSETDSTNAQLRRMLADTPDLPHGTAIAADFQTAGRGQRGASWESRRGENLMFSILLRPVQIAAARSFTLSQLVALATVEALDGYVPDLHIKWPNDIYYRDRKLAGTLIENDIRGAELSTSIAGIGINVNQTDFSAALPNPVSLAQIVNAPLDRDSLLENLISRIADATARHTPSDDDTVAARYRSRLYRNEGFHPYYDVRAQETILAAMVRVEPNGTLVLRTTAGDERAYTLKELKYLP